MIENEQRHRYNTNWWGKNVAIFIESHLIYSHNSLKSFFLFGWKGRWEFMLAMLLAHSCALHLQTGFESSCSSKCITQTWTIDNCRLCWYYIVFIKYLLKCISLKPVFLVLSFQVTRYRGNPCACLGSGRDHQGLEQRSRSREWERDDYPDHAQDTFASTRGQAREPIWAGHRMQDDGHTGSDTRKTHIGWKKQRRECDKASSSQHTYTDTSEPLIGSTQDSSTNRGLTTVYQNYRTEIPKTQKTIENLQGSNW